MTNNQINYLSLQETRRANRAKEDISARTLSESVRHSMRSEDETERSNRSREAETERSNRAKESFNILSLAETMRSNKEKEAETNRSNVEREKEAHRSNAAREREATRHNKWTEALDYSKQSAMPFIYTPEMVARDASLKNTLYMPDAERASGWIQSKVPTFGQVYDSIESFFGVKPHKSSSGANHGGKGGKFHETQKGRD